MATEIEKITHELEKELFSGFNVSLNWKAQFKINQIKKVQ